MKISFIHGKVIIFYPTTAHMVWIRNKNSAEIYANVYSTVVAPLQYRGTVQKLKPIAKAKISTCRNFD